MNTVKEMSKINTTIKKIIIDGINDNKSKKDIKKDFVKFLDNEIEEMQKAKVDDYLIKQVSESAKANFVKWYKKTMSGLYKMYFSGMASALIVSVLLNNGYKIKPKVYTKTGTIKTQTKNTTITKTQTLSKAPKPVDAPKNVPTTFSKDHTSQDYIKDYQERYNNNLNNILNNLSDSKFVDKNNGSLRNSAEIQTRFNEQKKYFGKLSKTNKFVIASAHTNCSKRCSYWQGKIFIIDTDLPTQITGKFDTHHPPTPKIMGHIDGKPYYSLKQAIDNGFLGYNCRHHLTSYKGQSVERVHPQTVLKARSINNFKRYLERQVRDYKRRAYINVDTNYKSNYTNKANLITNQYVKFCKDNKVESEMWRLDIK